MTFKFENLEVWQLAVQYCDRVYELSESLPRSEDFNLKSQIRRAATSICLNIAEGSTGQSDPEQNRFLGMALRSLYETIACQLLIRRRGYLQDQRPLDLAYEQSEMLARKIQAFRRSLADPRRNIREEPMSYTPDTTL
jgi:four helix bundle protein